MDEGIIGLEGLEVECLIGILPKERTTPQTISIDLKVASDFAPAAANEEIGRTVDYRQLAVLAEEEAKKGYQLVETLAWQILEEVFVRFSVKWGWVRICKHQVVPNTERVFVELKREGR